MIVLRSVVYNIYFYITVSLLAVLGSVAFLWPGPQPVLFVARSWGRASLWGLKHICGVTYELRGAENIPEGTHFIAACKHQSVMDTFTLPILFHRISFIHKKELFYLPFFGWLMWKGHQIGVDRSGRFGVMRSLIAECQRAVARGRIICIFPEGTRRPVDAEPRYKYGISAIYEALELPVLPIALNSGLFWKRRTFLRQPGRFIVEIMPLMPAGMDKDVFLAQLQDVIETRSNALVAEARA